MLSLIGKILPWPWRMFRLSHDNLQAYELIGIVGERWGDGVRNSLRTTQMRRWRRRRSGRRVRLVGL